MATNGLEITETVQTPHGTFDRKVTEERQQVFEETGTFDTQRAQQIQFERSRGEGLERLKRDARAKEDRLRVSDVATIKKELGDVQGEAFLQKNFNDLEDFRQHLTETRGLTNRSEIETEMNAFMGAFQFETDKKFNDAYWHQKTVFNATDEDATSFAQSQVGNFMDDKFGEGIKNYARSILPSLPEEERRLMEKAITQQRLHPFRTLNEIGKLEEAEEKGFRAKTEIGDDGKLRTKLFDASDQEVPLPSVKAFNKPVANRVLQNFESYISGEILQDVMRNGRDFIKDKESIVRAVDASIFTFISDAAKEAKMKPREYLQHIVAAAKSRGLDIQSIDDLDDVIANVADQIQTSAEQSYQDQNTEIAGFRKEIGDLLEANLQFQTGDLKSKDKREAFAFRIMDSFGANNVSDEDIEEFLVDAMVDSAEGLVSINATDRIRFKEYLGDIARQRVKTSSVVADARNGVIGIQEKNQQKAAQRQADRAARATTAQARAQASAIKGFQAGAFTFNTREDYNNNFTLPNGKLNIDRIFNAGGKIDSDQIDFPLDSEIPPEQDEFNRKVEEFEKQIQDGGQRDVNLVGKDFAYKYAAYKQGKLSPDQTATLDSDMWKYLDDNKLFRINSTLDEIRKNQPGNASAISLPVGKDPEINSKLKILDITPALKLTRKGRKAIQKRGGAVPTDKQIQAELISMSREVYKNYSSAREYISKPEQVFNITADEEGFIKSDPLLTRLYRRAQDVNQTNVRDWLNFVARSLSERQAKAQALRNSTLDDNFANEFGAFKEK